MTRPNGVVAAFKDGKYVGGIFPSRTATGRPTPHPPAGFFVSLLRDDARIVAIRTNHGVPGISHRGYTIFWGLLVASILPWPPDNSAGYRTIIGGDSLHTDQKKIGYDAISIVDRSQVFFVQCRH